MSRAVFGVLSIWCLGCSSLDIIIDRLVHGDIATAGCVMADDPPVPSESGRESRIQQRADAAALAGCGCDHCVATPTPATTLAVLPHPTPDTVEHKLGSALSVDREPLVPPPIGRTIA